MADFTFPGAVDVRGDLTIRGSILPAITRTQFAQNDAQVYQIQLSSAKVWDAAQNSLPSAGAADDLGLETGTWGTDVPHISTGDLKAAGATTRYCLFELVLPPEYVAGQTVTLRISSGMETTVSDTTSTIDVEAYLASRDGTVDGADICETDAQSNNSLTFAGLSFTFSATNCDPGDQLFVRIAAAVNDAATGTAVISTIGAVELLLDTQG